MFAPPAKLFQDFRMGEVRPTDDEVSYYDIEGVNQVIDELLP